MKSSLEYFLDDFYVVDADLLNNPDNRIITLAAKADNRNFLLKLSNIQEEALDQYLKNFKILSSLSHPNIVLHHSITVLDIPHHSFNAAEIQEMANFGTLIEYLKSNIKFSQVIHAFIQVFNGLDFLHQNGILHRDIKLTNMFVHELKGGFEVKVGDIEFWRSSTELDNRSTPEYLAPEVETYLDYTIKSEFWAIGVMLYELFTGKYPFGSRLDGFSIEQIRGNSRKMTIQGAEMIPPPFNEIIVKCLQKNSEDRPETMGELLEIFKKVNVV